jgi:hypothetical protein
MANDERGIAFCLLILPPRSSAGRLKEPHLHPRPQPHRQGMSWPGHASGRGKHRRNSMPSFQAGVTNPAVRDGQPVSSSSSFQTWDRIGKTTTTTDYSYSLLSANRTFCGSCPASRRFYGSANRTFCGSCPASRRFYRSPNRRLCGAARASRTLCPSARQSASAEPVSAFSQSV